MTDQLATAADSAGGAPLLLVIDTSSAQAGIALYDGVALSTRSWVAGRSHTTTLLAEIHHLLSASAVQVREVGAIAIAEGPGAFTGLRAGFGVAKGIHAATGVPLIGVSTLEATALPFAFGDRPIVATVAAGRGRLASAMFEPTTSGLLLTRPPRNSSVPELAAEVDREQAAIVVGELDDDQANLLAAVGNVTIPPRPLRLRQPAAIAELGWIAWRAGKVPDPAALEPVYLGG